jgi:hypothetical protein
MAGENHFAPVAGGEVNVDHAHAGKLLQHRTGCQTWSQITQPAAQGHMQAVGQEGDEDMGFDAFILLMMNRPHRQIALQVLKRLPPTESPRALRTKPLKPASYFHAPNEKDEGHEPTGTTGRKGGDR